MKTLSIKVDRTSAGGTYQKRTRGRKTKSLNITSLIDILTILLVFMIKNISMDATERDAPKGMVLPTTFTKDELVKSGQAVILKVYPDKILYGRENTFVGSMEDFMSNAQVRNALLKSLTAEAQNITDSDEVPILLIQADKNLYCKYITEMVKFSARSTFTNIYFSTVHTEDKNALLGIQ